MRALLAEAEAPSTLGKLPGRNNPESGSIRLLLRSALTSLEAFKRIFSAVSVFCFTSCPARMKNQHSWARKAFDGFDFVAFVKN
jgi:hypothetical protein